MTDAQSLVLSLLAATLGLEYIFGTGTRNFLHQLGQVVTHPTDANAAKAIGSQGVSVVVFWLLGAAILLGLAYYWPRIAIGVAGLLLLSVVFTRSNNLVDYTKSVTDWLAMQHTTQATAQGALAGVQSGGQSGGQQ